MRYRTLRRADSCPRRPRAAVGTGSDTSVAGWASLRRPRASGSPLRAHPPSDARPSRVPRTSGLRLRAHRRPERPPRGPSARPSRARADPLPDRRRPAAGLDLDRGLGLGLGRGLSLVHGVGSDILSGTDADPGDGSGARGRLGGRLGRLAGPGSAPSGLGDGRRGRIEAEMGRFGVIGFARREARIRTGVGAGLRQARPVRPVGSGAPAGLRDVRPGRSRPRARLRATTPADPEVRRGSRPRAAGRPAPARPRRRPPRRRSRPAVRPAPIPPGWPGSFACRRGPRGPVPAVERCRRETVGPRARAVRWMCAASRSREAVLPACRTGDRRRAVNPAEFSPTVQPARRERSQGVEIITDGGGAGAVERRAVTPEPDIGPIEPGEFGLRSDRSPAAPAQAAESPQPNRVWSVQFPA